MTTPLPDHYRTTPVVLPYDYRGEWKGMEGNGREWKGMEGYDQPHLSLWLLVVETLIFIIISQRARPMMIKTRRNHEQPG